MKIINGGICAPKGFLASATEANIKYRNRTDMAMIFSKVPAISAGVYTTNLVKAAPVLWDRKITDSETDVNAIVINSGIANACTKDEGMEYCRQSAKKAALELGVEENSILLASTGVIGMQLPIERICAGIESLSNSLEQSEKAANEAAKAIMTTDTVSKEVAIEFEISKKTVKMGAMCKGSGMIHPNMCTMLGFITTDVNISKELLLKALRDDVVDTFNMVSVDGDTSTNDSLIILANGLAENEKIVDENSEDYKVFKSNLNFVTTTLSKMIAGDGEGATALFEVVVEGAKTKETARTLAKSVVTSSLTKAAIFGHDANWGRILCALGYSGEKFDPDNMELYFESENGKILIYKDGVSVGFDEEKATKILSAKEVRALVKLNMGDFCATAWGCDLTFDYVKINADYRS
ncbi:bifunctional ornithine acetyltransferase/N-acetylglutamate synthase [Lachnoanaerobaculum gingivalis]|uniref:bifunctional ornithine acetyltransferase/N-acetylglutamate synthase n=1 Tax=Lachnoanaerobaculum gingivalis TaxID=2490855 RepID=UPI0024A69E21|nr:bifunctional ornithine acetyltransferase/N-acetylglutamate synthase [Lachnoanaerobaculum gingivalis]WHE87529.1 bifunctional ornithine acetyltransferase/N-acetylglutamate synthase [Lachnoanaerobaculum gingivalis]